MVAVLCVALVVGLAGLSSLSQGGAHVSSLFKRMWASSSGNVTQQARPNFIVIMADDLVGILFLPLRWSLSNGPRRPDVMQGFIWFRHRFAQGMYDLGYLNGNHDIYSPVIDDLANTGE
jgi:hypothetical protein